MKMFTVIVTSVLKDAHFCQARWNSLAWPPLRFWSNLPIDDLLTIIMNQLVSKFEHDVFVFMVWFFSHYFS